MKAVVLSICPKWCELIANGKKTVEVRKSAPNIEVPFKCYIYCTEDAKTTDRLWILNEQLRTKYGGLVAVCAYLENRDALSIGNGQVIGEFVCNGIIADKTLGRDEMFNACACMNETDAVAYCKGKEVYGWHISDLVIYDKPKALRQFGTLVRTRDWERGTEHFYVNEKWYKPMKKPPQSWCYVEERQNEALLY